MHFFNDHKSRTFFGGIFTVITYPILAVGLIYTLFISDYSAKDIVFTSSDISPFTEPNKGINLNETTHGNHLNFLTYINNPNFDNEDNPYGKFRLHIYTNMDNLTDTSIDGKAPPFKDVEVPVGVCQKGREVDWALD